MLRQASQLQCAPPSLHTGGFALAAEIERAHGLGGRASSTAAKEYLRGPCTQMSLYTLLSGCERTWVEKGVSGGLDVSSGPLQQCGLLMLENMQAAMGSQLQHGQGLYACQIGFVLTAAENIKVCVVCSNQSAAPWPEPSLLK